MRIKGLILGFVPKHLAQRGTHCPFYATAQEESGGEGMRKRDANSQTTRMSGLYVEKCTQALEASSKDTRNPTFLPEWAKC